MYLRVKKSENTQPLTSEYSNELTVGYGPQLALTAPAKRGTQSQTPKEKEVKLAARAVYHEAVANIFELGEN